jgi:hypothetical protein
MRSQLQQKMLGVDGFFVTGHTIALLARFDPVVPTRVIAKIRLKLRSKCFGALSSGVQSLNQELLE